MTNLMDFFASLTIHLTACGDIINLGPFLIHVLIFKWYFRYFYVYSLTNKGQQFFYYLIFVYLNFSHVNGQFLHTSVYTRTCTHFSVGWRTQIWRDCEIKVLLVYLQVGKVEGKMKAVLLLLGSCCTCLEDCQYAVLPRQAWDKQGSSFCRLRETFLFLHLPLYSIRVRLNNSTLQNCSFLLSARWDPFILSLHFLEGG